ncbi:hypothetical protein CLOP_g7787 [Closterium sp. NIES-67]|nr:hypothetical protein CLOP_g7787 [Closterium sp. NIES-67]
MVQKRQRAEGQPSTRKSPRFAAAADDYVNEDEKPTVKNKSGSAKEDEKPTGRLKSTRKAPRVAAAGDDKVKEVEEPTAKNKSESAKGDDNPTAKNKSDFAKEGQEPSASNKSKESTAGDDANPKDLYAVLGVNRDATHAEIRKAYHRMALRLHPDKNPGDETAKDRFQALQRVFAVLGDAERRKLYDATGCTGDGDGEDESGLSGDTVTDLYKFFRNVYSEITVEDIEAFERQYRGSEQEAKELKELYQRFKGRMDMVLECHICTRDIDSHRFMGILDAAIESGELKATKAYKRWAAEVAKKPAPKDPLAVSNSNDNHGLMALIRNRQTRARENDEFFESLAAKYGGKGGRGKGGEGKRGGGKGGRGGGGRVGGGKVGGEKGDDEGGEGDKGGNGEKVGIVSGKGKGNGKRKEEWKEPTEEEFQAARARVLKKNAQ